MVHPRWNADVFGVVNVLAYLFFLGSNIYTVSSLQPIYENMRQTYFTPSIWLFNVWHVVHALFIAPIIYQFASVHGQAVVVDGISWKFPLQATLYAIFVVVWANHQHTAAFVVSLLLNYISGKICSTLKKEHPPKSVHDELLVYLPFSVCQAWDKVLWYLSAFEAFGFDATEHRNGIWTNVFVFLSLFCLQLDAVLFVLSDVEGDTLAWVVDRPGVFVISLALWAVSDHQRSSGFIHWSATVFFILSLLWDALAIYDLQRRFPYPSSSEPDKGNPNEYFRSPLIYGWALYVLVGLVTPMDSGFLKKHKYAQYFYRNPSLTRASVTYLSL